MMHAKPIKEVIRSWGLVLSDPFMMFTSSANTIVTSWINPSKKATLGWVKAWGSVRAYLIMYKPDLAPGMHWKCNIRVVKNKHIYKSVLLLTLKVVLEIESTQKMKKL